MTKIISDWSDMDREVTRISGPPSRRVRRYLDEVLDAGFALTQAAVHVQTGALKASGDHDSKFDAATDTWEGRISYGTGGEDNGGVDYAIYEQQRGIGGAEGPSDAKGDHDFLAPLETIKPLFAKAILRGLAK